MTLMVRYLPLSAMQVRRLTLPLAVVVVAMAVIVPSTTSAADALPGSAGIDTSLPLTDSKRTERGRGLFSGLEVTVNQTGNLVNQAVSVTWTGGTRTQSAGGGVVFGEHFLQMFQCWGEDDGQIPDQPGPPPEQCQQGATDGVYGGRSPNPVSQSASSRQISHRRDPAFDPGLGTLQEPSGTVWKPFRAVDGTEVPYSTADVEAFRPNSNGDFWLNPYYDITTTNEVAGSRTTSAGTGAELFELDTGIESSGLGCGQSVQKLADGSTKIPKCWLVIVPRGTTADENEGRILDPNFGVSTSPLGPKSWKNRIAFPLEFNPVGSSCPISADQRVIGGTEMSAPAVISWQPALCATPGLSPYAYNAVGDGRARQQLLSGGFGAPGMAVMSRPIPPDSLRPSDPIVYAPLTLSGTVIGFNVERITESNFVGGRPPPEVLSAADELLAVRVAQLNLTPRLVAKLLTQSYRLQVEMLGSKPPYSWSPKNPPHLEADPDFLQFNPEFELLRADSKNMSGLVTPDRTSDAALQVWEWILADPEARTWLAGTPDPWGMNVNPVYSTSPLLNPLGASFGDPLPDSYPKGDPYCYQGPDLVNGTLTTTPPPLCGPDWLPYAQSLRSSARTTRAAADGARIELNSSAISPDQVYKSEPPQLLGSRSILSITDTPSASQFGVQMARLSRAGDNGADRSFIAPDEAGLSTGGKALTARDVPDFLEPKPSQAPPGGYPLTVLTYGAVAPLSLDATARKEYAAFVDYAAGPGQVRGYEYGKLPVGYQPLTEPLQAQARAAAGKIRDLKPEVVEEPAPDDEPGSQDSPAASGPGAAAGELDDAPDQVLPGPGIQLPAPSAAGAPLAEKDKGTLGRVVDAVATPLYKLGATRYALPLLVVVSLLAALGALEITKRRSRWTSAAPPPLNEPDTA